MKDHENIFRDDYDEFSAETFMNDWTTGSPLSSLPPIQGIYEREEMVPKPPPPPVSFDKDYESFVHKLAGLLIILAIVLIPIGVVVGTCWVAPNETDKVEQVEQLEDRRPYLTAIALGDPEQEANELENCKRIAPRYSAVAEVLMPDGTRCDLLSDKYAIEVDWAANKWKESIGQAVLYAIWTDREPAIVLLVKDSEKEKLDLLRCRLVCERLRIKLFLEDVNKGTSLTDFPKFETVNRGL